MSVLVLDDSPNRLRIFRRGLIGTPVHLCSRADEAITLLGQHQPRVVFLDYDLDQYDGAPNPGTGLEVVNWIAANAEMWRKTEFFIHSINPVGAGEMVNALRAARLRVHYYPGAWEHPSLLDFAVARARAHP